MRFALVLAALAPVFAQDEEQLTLKFKYAAGERETMGMKLHMRMDVGVYAGAETFEQKMEGPMGFSLGLSCKTVGEGKFGFEGEMGGLEVNQDMVVNGMNMKMSIKGKNLRVENAEGEAVIDTEKGVNAEAADEILKEFSAFGQKFELAMDERGLVKGLSENEKIKEFFGGMAGENLYPVVLPDKTVKIGEEWTYVAKMKELGKLKLSGEGVEVPLKYRLEHVEAAGGGARVAVIVVKQETALKDLELEGDLEGLPAGAKILIKSMKVTGKGETRFLIDSGRIQTSEFEAQAKAEMKIKIEGMDEMEGVVDVKIKAKAAPKKEEPAK
ncbi:MAG TPA: hypothetical protein VI643_03770 [Planctomycetota bacterium]|nr:hypothetical protein [Planctomycetota bacterium]